MPHGIKDGKLAEIGEDEVDVELRSPSAFFGTNVNLIPLQSAVQVPRLFYGARFFNQAVPLVDPQAPLVQNLAEDGETFDEKAGRMSGAVFADDDVDILDATPDAITYRTAAGETKTHELYNNFKLNRKSSWTQSPLVAKGDRVAKGGILARSNFTDDKGRLALGRNARVALVPYKGYSMDDAVVVSDAFAKSMRSVQDYDFRQDFDTDTKGGKKHYASLFPTEFKKAQLDTMDDDGVVLPGTVLREGDPVVLATRPKTISSSSAQTGRLSKALAQARSSAAQVWGHEDPGVVTDVARTKSGIRVVVKSEADLKRGDKIVLRNGQKGIVSKILTDKEMPRTRDGKKLDVLLNPLGLPSRVNSATPYELLLGKAAEADGATRRLPSFTAVGDDWHTSVSGELEKLGLADKEDLFDPVSGTFLENPVTVGVGHVLKLMHMVEGKSSSRGQGGYDQSEQPMRGGFEGAQAKRTSGLDVYAMLSSGAYANLREGATLRGQKNDSFWRTIREGHTPRAPGKPFVWDKFNALLEGSGMFSRNMGGGTRRLGPMTDRELDSRKPIEVRNGELVDSRTLAPIAGGLFDTATTGANKWGYIRLPRPVPNPAFEDGVATLLGLSRRQLDAVMDGREELPAGLFQ